MLNIFVLKNVFRPYLFARAAGIRHRRHSAHHRPISIGYSPAGKIPEKKNVSIHRLGAYGC